MQSPVEALSNRFPWFLLVAHAEADDPANWPGADHDRPLTKEGVEQCQRAAGQGGWYNSFFSLSRVAVSSATVRCMTTFMRMRSRGPVIVVPEIYPPEGFNEYFKGIPGRPGLRHASLRRYLEAGALSAIEEGSHCALRGIADEIGDSQADILEIHGHGPSNRAIAWAIAKLRGLDDRALVGWETSYAQGILVQSDRVRWLR